MTLPKIGAKGRYDDGDGCSYSATVVGHEQVWCPVIVFDLLPNRRPFVYRPSDPVPFVCLPEDFTEVSS